MKLIVPSNLLLTFPITSKSYGTFYAFDQNFNYPSSYTGSVNMTADPNQS